MPLYPAAAFLIGAGMALQLAPIRIGTKVVYVIAA